MSDEVAAGRLRVEPLRVLVAIGLLVALVLTIEGLCTPPEVVIEMPKAMTMAPVGDCDPELVEELARRVGMALLCDVKAADVAIPLPPNPGRPERDQYRAADIIDFIHTTLAGGGSHTLAVTEEDLYSDDMNFVLGLAEVRGRGAVISLARLRPEYYDQPPDRELLLERATKTSIHEIGHMMGLRHCPNEQCVMHFALSVAAVDAVPPEFCPRCARRLGLR